MPMDRGNVDLSVNIAVMYIALYLFQIHILSYMTASDHKAKYSLGGALIFDVSQVNGSSNDWRLTTDTSHNLTVDTILLQ